MTICAAQPPTPIATPPTPAASSPIPSPAPNHPDPSDDAATEAWTLVERAQTGESEAFGLIYDRYVDTIFRFIYFRVGNRQLAEDLTSDTFLRALKRIGSFTWQGRDLGAWLVTIARNLVADHFKSARYRLEVTTGDVLDADREDRGPEGSPETATVDHITNLALLGAVKQLNPEQQECIVLRFLQGFSVAETAQAMGKNECAIKALQYRAVRALDRLLPADFKAGFEQIRPLSQPRRRVPQQRHAPAEPEPSRDMSSQPPTANEFLDAWCALAPYLQPYLRRRFIHGMTTAEIGQLAGTRFAHDYISQGLRCLERRLGISRETVINLIQTMAADLL